MKTNIETNTKIASYIDSFDLRNRVFEKVIELFTKYNFDSYDIYKSGESENLITEIEQLIDFEIKYKSEDE